MRQYQACPHCGLVCLSPQWHPGLDEARARYELHRNRRDDAGYRRWLQEFIDQGILPWVGSGDALDFGSGPTPLLAELLCERGFRVRIYDLHFAPDVDWENHEYDLICLCEVLEHIADPLTLVRRLCVRLKPGGVLALRTRFRPEKADDFFRWWYRQDPTHLSFFAPGSLVQLACSAGLQVLALDPPDRAAFRRPA